MSKHDVFMPLMIGDFLRDTMRLDTEQQGMYLLLLIEYWSKGPLPDDPRILQKICKISGHIFHKKFPDIREIFLEKDGRLHHPDMDAEKARSLALHESLSKAGKKGNAVKWSQGDKKTDRPATAQRSHSHSHSHSHRDSPESLSDASGNTDTPEAAQAPDETGEGEAGSGNAETALIRHAIQHLAGIDPNTPAARLALTHWQQKSVTSGELERAVAIARTYKPTGRIALNYLKTIVQDRIIAARETPTHENRRQPAAKREHLSPSEIVLAACRAEQQAETGIFDGTCEIIH